MVQKLHIKFWILLLLLALSARSFSQQNHALYLMHNIEESNQLNPSIPITCKWFVGLPVISSVHFNYGNSSLSFNDIFFQNTDASYSPNLASIRQNLNWRNLLSTEIHTQLFALGYKQKNTSFIFSMNEKVNVPITFPRELALVLLDGNATFLNAWAGSKGTGIFLNYYREYALGVSKKITPGISAGIKAKLLFGKLNMTTRSTNIQVFTADDNFNLEFDGNFLMHSSLPITVDASNNKLNSVNYNDATITELLLNRKNPGFAIDAGIIYDMNNKIQLSASIIDLGFIRWRSNLNNFEGTGNFTFQGLVGDPANYQSYFNNLSNSFLQSANFEVNQNKYTSYLSPRLMAAANYKFNSLLSAGIIGNGIMYWSKFVPALTFTGNLKASPSIGLMASYTVQYYSFNMLGAGMYLGINPIQFYLVSDNIIALIKPLDARNINLRFGLNLNFGCPKNHNPDAVSKGEMQNCFGMGTNRKKSYKEKFIPWKKRKNK
jgi:hypothetical protein